MDPPVDPLHLALARHFGFSAFRPGQREVIDAVVAGRNVLAVMPTGAGKSLCYQLPAVLDEGTTLVISPLIALMKDQVEALTARGVAATLINSHIAPAERQRRLQAARDGAYRLLYLAPERLRVPGFVETLRGAPLTRMAVDEAHCISQWGHDFRPEYRELPRAMRALGITQVCSFTATATPEVRQDIVEALDLGHSPLSRPQLIVHGFARDNLTLRVIPLRRQRHKLDLLLRLTRSLDSGSGGGIVYAATRKRVDKVAQALSATGRPVGRYHAGLEPHERDTVQGRFMRGELTVVVATNAFGMGIDKPDIRFVAHHDLPGSLEAYYQEVGRAGRDGLPAECPILFSHADVHVHEFFIDQIGTEAGDRARSRPLSAQQVQALQRLERAKLRRMLDYCYTTTCRHQLLLRYFGERTNGAECVRLCDRCLERDGRHPPDWARDQNASGSPVSAARRAPPTRAAQPPGETRAARPPSETRPAQLPGEAQTLLVQKVLSAFARAGGRLTSAQVVALLRGTARRPPADLRASRSFALLAGHPASGLRAIVAELVARQALTATAAERSRYRLTPLGAALMRRERTIPLRLPASTAEPGAAGPAAEDRGLFDALVQTRRELARQQSVPPYVVAHDAVLRRLAAQRPTTDDELLAVKGIGPAKLARFGQPLLATVRRFVD